MILGALFNETIVAAVRNGSNNIGCATDAGWRENASHSASIAHDCYLWSFNLVRRIGDPYLNPVQNESNIRSDRLHSVFFHQRSLHRTDYEGVKAAGDLFEVLEDSPRPV